MKLDGLPIISDNDLYRSPGAARSEIRFLVFAQEIQ